MQSSLASQLGRRSLPRWRGISSTIARAQQAHRRPSQSHGKRLRRDARPPRIRLETLTRMPHEEKSDSVLALARSAQAAPSRQEKIALALSAFIALLVHWHFRLSGFGEQDAARLAGDAIHWHENHEILMAKVDYRLRTSPLYIHSLKLALDHRLPIRALPWLMNGVSVALSSVCLVGLYFLFRRLSSPRVAAAATFMYALTPCFWLGSVYGMPTLPSLTFWVFATLAFARATDEPDWRDHHFYGFMALALLLASIAFALKADMALSSGALLTVLIFHR